MRKLLIFDVDGTTLDTLDTIIYFVNLTMVDLGLDIFEKEEIINSIGYSSEYLIKEALNKRNYDYDDEELQRVMGIYHKHYQSDVTYMTKPYDGIVELLENLKSQGYLLAALSNKPEHTLSKVFEALDFAKYFDFSIGQIDNIPKKPEPNMVYMIKEKFGVSLDDICLIGDTEVDYNTAKNASVEFIGVSWGFRTIEELSQLHITHLAHSVKELGELLNSGVIL